MPPVRVELGAGVLLALLGLARDLVGRVIRGDGDLDRVSAGFLDDLPHPVVEAVAGRDDELRARGGLDVGRPRLVLVWVAVGVQELVDLGPVARDLADDVAELGRRRDDQRALRLGGGAAGVVVVSAAGGEQHGDEGDASGRSTTCALAATRSTATTSARSWICYSTRSSSPTS
jgi:hypothetical protein